MRKVRNATVDRQTICKQGRSCMGFCGGGPDNRGAAGAENSRAELGTPTNFLIEFVQISGVQSGPPASYAPVYMSHKLKLTDNPTEMYIFLL
jgi:hypothetical protein